MAAAVLGVLWWLPATGPAASSHWPGGRDGDSNDVLLLRSATEAMRAGRMREAERLAMKVDPASPAMSRALMLAAEVASRTGRVDEAIARYETVSELGTSAATEALFYLGEQHRAAGRLERAAEYYQRFLGERPDDGEAHARLAFIYSVTGQRWQAMPHFLATVALQNWTLDSLALLGDLERPIEQPEFIASCLNSRPTDPFVQMGAAQLEAQRGDDGKAVDRLRKVIRRRPELVAAHALLGESVISQGDEAYLEWEQNLPPGAEEHADVWFVRGLRARGRSELGEAAGCFAESLRIRPEHRRSTYQLGQVLASLQDPAASAFVSRAERLVELSQQLDVTLKSRGRSEQALRACAEICESVGRLLEAYAWTVTAARLHGKVAWTEAMRERFRGRVSPGMPRTVPEADLVASHDLQRYVAAARDSIRSREGELASRRPPRASPPQDPEELLHSRIRFAPAEAGIDFVYENGADPETPGARMFEQTGGGVAVLDYDLDGWPDLHFTQGGIWETGETQPTPDARYRDHVYRNLAGDRFREIAANAGVENLGFGQGVAAGDFNGDGFPDLYVANAGANRLWRNNGDGTFTDVSDAIETASDRWTTSCAMVDLDGDGLLDLFDVNYLEGEGVFTRLCGGKACSPSVFPGAPDDAYRNRGDGTFHKLNDATPRHDAKGLGLVAARFGDDSRVSLFVANDQVPNFFLRVQSAVEPSDEGTADAATPPSGSVHGPDGGPFRLVDEALLRGLAYNVDGLALACMGVAADDADGNGRLDLLATNFMDEPNSLYLQDAARMFVDATRAAGLQQPSFPYTGWGTQFLDADLDGRSDLVVTNGHIDDLRDEGKPYRMPPQFFRNLGRARFEPLSPEQLGSFFQGKYLGRGLARLDFNRDGRTEFAVSNIGQPAELVVNRTDNAGAYLNVELVGTASARDPIGARVEAVTDRGSWQKQLVAGDGFQASNQRVVQFGLGSAGEIRQVTVQWPSGKRTELEGLPINTQVLIVEGAERAFVRKP